MAERALAVIKKIDKIYPIDGSDFIELAKIGGWQVVISKKENFKPGDLVVYCEIDSVLPKIEMFDFLQPKRYRIKTQKIRGVLSQGIVFPLSILNNFGYPKTDNTDIIYIKTTNEGIDQIFYVFENSDVTDLIGIIKYEIPESSNLRGESRSTFPIEVPKTDETRIQNLTKEVTAWGNANIPFVISEKLEGCSVTYILKEGELHVCSRNQDLKESEDNTYWKVAKQLDIENKLKSLNRNIALQGELIGPGIQKNIYGLTNHEVRFFNAFDIDEQKYLSFEKFETLINNLELQTVPILNRSFYLQSVSLDELLAMSEGLSLLNKKQQREGIVFRSRDFIENNHNKISFKVISNKYLLNEKD